MGICGYVLPANCCQPTVAGGVIYADLWGGLSTHLAQQALFTQSSLLRDLLLQAFPFPSTLGEMTLHQLSQACMFIYSSRGKWVFSPLLWSFPPTATFTSFPTPICWACAAAPTGRCVYLQFMWEVGLSPLLWSFPPSATLTSFPTPGCWHTPQLPPSLLWPGPACLFTVPGGIPLPSSLALRVPHPLCYMSLFLLLITQFLFFPPVGVGLSRELC
jgi:hypothetical protein